MSNENIGEIKKSLIQGYAVSSKIKECLEEEGFVALRLVQDTHCVRYCETLLVFPGDFIPQELDMVIPQSMTRCYGDLIVIEGDFSQMKNWFQKDS